MEQKCRWVLDKDLYEKAIDEYYMPEQYFEEFYTWSEDKRRDVQDERLRREVQRASNVPMFQRLWRKAGFDPSKFRGLEDLHKIPMYTIEDIRESIKISPPYGDYQGAIPGPNSIGNRLFFSGGTTGTPRPTVYTPWDRVVGSLLGARHFYHHGVRPGDVVMNSFAYSTHNGGFIIDEALWHWLGATPITTSTGVVTNSRKQLELARDYGAVTIMTTSDYLLKLRKEADEMGLKPSDFNFKFFTTIGDTESAAKAWGVPVYEYYAFHEVQTVAIDCLEKKGMHIFEDCFIVEVVDPETGEPLPDGETGDLVITCLYKTGSPQVRFNIKDLSSLIPGECSCSSGTKRISKLAGRSDTMVKLRGINIWPEAIGSVLMEYMGRPVEYFCIAYKKESQDYMRAFIELSGEEMSSDFEEKAGSMLKNRLGVKIEVQQVGRGDLTEVTGTGKQTKLKRFKDERMGNEFSDEIRKIFR